MGSRSQALSVAMVYAAFGALWILLSDTALGWLIQDRDTLLLIGTAKGWLFVLLSAALVFFLVARQQGTADSPMAHEERIPWVAFAVMSMAIVLVTGGTALQAWQQERSKIAGLLRAIAYGKADRLADWYADERWHVERLGQSQGLAETWQRWSTRPNPALLGEIGSKLDTTYNDAEYSVRLLDSSLRQVWPQAVGPIPPDPELRDALLATQADRQVRSVGPWRNADGELTLAFVGPIAAESRKPGLLVVQVKANAVIAPVLEEWPVPHATGEAFLFARQGDEVAFLSNLKHDPEAAGRRRESLQHPTLFTSRTLRGETAMGNLLEGTDYRGVPAFGVALPVVGTDWFLLVKQDRQELLSSAIYNAATLALAALLGLFSAFAGAYLFLQRRALARSARDISALEHSQTQLRDSEARYRLLAENSHDIVWLLDIATLRLVYISPACNRLVGYTSDELLHMGLEQIIVAEDLERAMAWLREQEAHLRKHPGSSTDTVMELAHHHKAGGTVPIEVAMRLLSDDQGQPVQVQGVSRDITERKQAEHQIRQLSQATRQSPVAVLMTNPQGIIEYVNPAFERMSGYSASEVIGRNPRLLQSTRTPRETYRRMWGALKRGEPWHGELINRRKDGRHYLQAVTIAPMRDERGQVVQYISVQQDITAQRAAEERAELLVWFDPLTGLPNRQRLMSELGELLKRQGPGQLSGLLLVNADRFKGVNEALGHSAGDQLLQALADRLRTSLQGNDMLAHLNGDEFGLLVQNLHGDGHTVSGELMRRAEQIHEAMQRPLQLGDETLGLTVSIGVTLLGTGIDESASDVLRRADTALHRAKEAGGHQTAFFDAGMGRLVSERFVIEQDLRRGIEAGELRLYLQPQVNAEGRTVSAEALVRWQHPDKGLVPPALFIPVAEDSGLIQPIGHWVLEQVCERLGQIRRAGQRMPLSVNISPRQFHQRDFSQQVLQLLERHGANASDLILEITEGVVVQEVDAVIRRMGELTRHGVRFSIDDFGTGYSSLSYLKNLPIHELKIDRSFVQDAPTDPSDAALVEAILSVANHLRLRVVAEGVETPEHAAFFRAHPGVLMQGYLYGRPEAADALIQRWLKPQD